jgi:hypothetical protein
MSDGATEDLAVLSHVGEVATEPASPTAAVAAGAGTLPESMPPASKRQRLRRTVLAPLIFLRYLLRKVIWLVVRVFRVAWAHPLITLALFMAIAVGYQGYDRYIREEAPPPPPEQFDIVVAIPPAPAAQQYVEAEKNLDADALWDSLSEQLKTQYLSRGFTLETLRQQLDGFTTSGIRVGDSRYVGGVAGGADDGTFDHYFFVTELHFSNGQRGDLYQVIVIDPRDNKISEIVSPLPVLPTLREDS